MTRLIALAAFAVFLLFAFPDLALAQAYKCKDAKGRTTYSDAPCLGQDASAVNTTGNTVDGSAGRAGASRPEGSSSSSGGGQSSGGMSEQQRQDRVRELEMESKRIGNTPQQRRAAKKELDDLMGGGSSSNAATPPRKASPAESSAGSSGPAIVTNCDPGGCWDTQGRRYNKGAGSTFIRADGRTCQQVGNQFQCN